MLLSSSLKRSLAVAVPHGDDGDFGAAVTDLYNSIRTKLRAANRAKERTGRLPYRERRPIREEGVCVGSELVTAPYRRRRE